MKDGFLKDRAIAYHVASKRLQYFAKNVFKTLFCKTKIGQTLSTFFNNEQYDSEIAKRSDLEKVIIENHNRKIREKRDEKLMEQFGQYLSEDDLEEYSHRNDSLMQTAKRFVDLYENMNSNGKNIDDESQSRNLDEPDNFNFDDDFDDDFTK